MMASKRHILTQNKKYIVVDNLLFQTSHKNTLLKLGVSDMKVFWY